jgi:hypothetical protein
VTTSQFLDYFLSREKLDLARSDLLETLVDLLSPGLLDFNGVLKRFVVQACNEQLGEPGTLGHG